MNKYKQRADGRYLAQIKIGYQDNGKPKLKNIYAKSKAELDRKVTEYKSQVNKRRCIRCIHRQSETALYM